MGGQLTILRKNFAGCDDLKILVALVGIIELILLQIFFSKYINKFKEIIFTYASQQRKNQQHQNEI